MDEKIKYLPLGSVVILKGGVQKVVVLSRGLVTTIVDPPVFFDYGGCLYPQGLMGEQILYFNHKDITKVVHEGHEDESEILMQDVINEFRQNCGHERMDTQEFLKRKGVQDG